MLTYLSCFLAPCNLWAGPQNVDIQLHVGPRNADIEDIEPRAPRTAS